MTKRPREAALIILDDEEENAPIVTASNAAPLNKGGASLQATTNSSSSSRSPYIFNPSASSIKAVVSQKRLMYDMVVEGNMAGMGRGVILRYLLMARALSSVSSQVQRIYVKLGALAEIDESSPHDSASPSCRSSFAGFIRKSGGRLPANIMGVFGGLYHFSDGTTKTEAEMSGRTSALKNALLKEGVKELGDDGELPPFLILGMPWDTVTKGVYQSSCLTGTDLAAEAKDSAQSATHRSATEEKIPAIPAAESQINSALDELIASLLPRTTPGPRKELTFGQKLTALERLRSDEFKGNLTECSKALGVSEATLRSWLKDADRIKALGSDPATKDQLRVRKK